MRDRHAAAPLVVLLVPAACDGQEAPGQFRALDGNRELGQALIAKYGCTAAHGVPGVEALTDTVGPLLVGFTRRADIAGRLPNRPSMLMAWLLGPPAVGPETAASALGRTGRTAARGIAARLCALR